MFLEKNSKKTHLLLMLYYTHVSEIKKQVARNFKDYDAHTN